MKWSKPKKGEQESAAPVTRVTFDVIRALAAVRQQSAPTIAAMREVDAKHRSEETSGDSKARMKLFNGHGDENERAPSGPFHRSDTQDQPVQNQDKQQDEDNA